MENRLVADASATGSVSHSVTVATVADHFVRVMDGPFMSYSLRSFYHQLDLPGHNYDKLIYQYRVGAEGALDIIMKILQDWVQNIGTFATTGQLIAVLEEIGSIAMADELRSVFPRSMTIIVSSQPGNGVDGQNMPNHLPLFFQLSINTRINQNTELVGRHSEINGLLTKYKKFRQNPTGSGIVLIKGPSCVGKSLLANEFCHSVRETFNHSCIWLNGNSSGALADSVQRLAVKLLRHGQSDSSSSEELDFSDSAELLFERVHRYHKNTPILLVIDGIQGDNYTAKTLLSSLSGLSFPRVFVVLTSNCNELEKLLDSRLMDSLALSRLKIDMATAFSLYFQEPQVVNYPVPQTSWAFPGRDNVNIAESPNATTPQSLSRLDFTNRYLNQENISLITQLSGNDPMFAFLFIKYLSYRNSFQPVSSNSNSTFNPITKFLEQVKVIVDERYPYQTNSTLDELISKTLTDFLNLLDNSEKVQGCGSFLLKLIYWLMPQGKVDLTEIRDTFSCIDSGLGVTHSPCLSATMTLLIEYGLLRVDPQVLVNGTIPDNRMVVELHPALRNFFKNDRNISDVKKGLGEPFIKCFNELNPSTANTFVCLNEQLLQNFVEFRNPTGRKGYRPSLYSQMENLLKFAEDPKAAYATWIRWLSVVAGYNFMYTFVVSIGMGIFFLLSPPRGSDLAIVILLAWCSLAFFVYCGVVCYVGMHILRDSSTMLMKLFAGDLANKKLILQATTAGVISGYVLVTGLFAVVDYSFTIYVVIANYIYIVGFLLIVFKIFLIKTVFRNDKIKQMKGKRMESEVSLMV